MHEAISENTATKPLVSQRRDVVKKYRVLDITNTHECARDLLDHRVVPVKERIL